MGELVTFYLTQMKIVLGEYVHKITVSNAKWSFFADSAEICNCVYHSSIAYYNCCITQKMVLNRIAINHKPIEQYVYI